MGDSKIDGQNLLLEGKSVEFRPMAEGDIPAISEIETLSFTTPWTEEAFRRELKHNPFAYYTVATHRERVMAYCGVWLVVDEAHVTNVAVHPKFRGKGIGKQLLTYVMAFVKGNGADRMTLEVRPSNRVARRLYESLGFVHEGTRPNYYPDNDEDAWIMWVNLK